MKTLFLDIETSPNLATVWGLFKQNIGINQLIDSSYTLCWAAAWAGDDTIYFDSVHQSARRSMVKSVHKLLDEADVVVHYNGTSFDIPVLNREFLMHGLLPPSPYKQVDLLRVVRKKFRFTSNKMDYVARQLGLEGKTKHTGHELWLKCMEKDPEAWALMEEYNLNDVVVLEELYNTLLPWISNHPNRSVYDEATVCPTCGGKQLQRRGYQITTTGKYQRFQCSTCGTWSRAIKSEAFKERLVGV